MGTMREISGVTSSMAVSDEVEEVEGVPCSSHWSGSKSPSGLSGCGVGVAGQVADADDAALDGAAEAVGVGEQRGLRRWSGLYLRGPQAGGDPERRATGRNGEAEDFGAGRGG